MDIKIDFDADQWARQLKRAVRDTTSEAMDKMGAELQAVLDGVERTHAGKDPAEVEAELRRRLGVTDFNLDDEHIKAYAAAIAAGQHIHVAVDKSELDRLS